VARWRACAGTAQRRAVAGAWAAAGAGVPRRCVAAWRGVPSSPGVLEEEDKGGGEKRKIKEYDMWGLRMICGFHEHSLLTVCRVRLCQCACRLG
jgi:hypothetical protein